MCVYVCVCACVCVCVPNATTALGRRLADSVTGCMVLHVYKTSSILVVHLNINNIYGAGSVNCNMLL